MYACMYLNIYIQNCYLGVHEVSSRLGWRLFEETDILNHVESLLNVPSILLDLVGQGLKLGEALGEKRHTEQQPLQTTGTASVSYCTVGLA